MKLRNLIFSGLAGFGIWQFFRQQAYSNQVSLRNKVVIITGASSGIGRVSAKIFAAQGAHLILVARRANRLADVQSEIQQEFDVRVLTVAGDVTKQDDINQVVTTALEEFGRIDVLVNNAGIFKGGYLEEKDFDLWESVIDINLSGAIRMAQSVLPLMKAQRSGHIVNVGSVVEFAGSPGRAVYVASKTALGGFSQALRREVFPFNINISHIMPGFTDTPMNEGQFEKLMEDDAAQYLIQVESPEYVASNIVGAVRYNKPQVVLGGLPMTLIYWLNRLSPSIIDLMYTRFVDSEQLVRNSDVD